MSNPFDEFDDDEFTGPVLSSSPGWEPTFSERFWGNVRDSQRYTPEGALGSAGRLNTGDGAGSLEEEEASRERTDIADYEAMSPSDSLLDYVAAVGGQVAGSVTPSAMVAAPVRVAQRVAPAAGRTIQTAIDRAIGGAIANAGLDVATQGVRMETGLQDQFEPLNTAVSLLAGAGLSGGTAFLPGGRVADDAVPVGQEGNAGNVFDQFDGTAEPAEAADLEELVPPVEELPEPALAPEIDDAIRQPAPVMDTLPSYDPAAVAPAPGQAAGVFVFDASKLETDAGTFQFKSGGDQEGVTEALKSVRKWDRTKANQGIVWESEDGRLFAVDGHQRSGLARRIKAQDPAQETLMTGVLYRESDGVTREEVTAIAAAKNIAEGSGSVVDAAKVLRLKPDLADATMPLSSEKIQTSRALTALTDEAFGMVVNDVVPANYAAEVGRLLPNDPARQMAAMDLLAKAEPSSQAEAQSLVRQVREEAIQMETTSSLFGEEEVARSLVIEKSKVVAAAGRLVRSDRKVFNTLVAEAERIEGEGNILAKDKNASRASAASEALGKIDALAYRKGEIGDALTQAAEAIRAGTPVARAARDFLTAVARSDELGAQGGRSAGGGGGDTAASRSAEGFDEVANDDQPNLIAARPKSTAAKIRPERTQEGQGDMFSASVEDARARLERATEGGLQGGNTTLPPNGIFDDVAVAQQDLFDVKARTRGGVEYPLADPPEYEFSNYAEMGGRIIYMEPEQYLALSKPLDVDASSQENIDDLAGIMRSGRKIDPPRLTLEGNNVSAHDGRHRALAAKSIGVKRLPVLVVDMMNDKVQSDLSKMVGQDGNTVDFSAPTPSTEELAKLLVDGATPDEIAAHPVFADAVRELETRQPTTSLPGYGTPEFQAARRFNFDGEEVVGYEAATARLIDVANAYAEGEVLKDGVATIVLGPPAAGKSRLSERLAIARGAAIVDPDDAKKALPEYDGGIGANAVHEESAYIAGQLVLPALARERANIILPKVGQNPQGISKLIEGLQAVGYKVEVANLAVSYDNAFRRMVARFLKTGRIINPEYVKFVGESPAATYRALKADGKASDYVEIDGNGTSAGTPAILDGDGELAAILGPRGGRDAEPVGGAREAPATEAGRPEVNARRAAPGGGEVRARGEVRASSRPNTQVTIARPQAGIPSQGKANIDPLESLVVRLTEAAPEGTAFRQGRVAAKNLGEFNTGSGVVRQQTVSDIETQAHEVAHAYEARFGAALDAVKDAHRAEVEALAYQGAAPGTELSEGFAEFIRHYVTNPAYARAQAPNFAPAFEAFMSATAPDKLEILKEVADAYKEYLAAPSGAVVKSDIVTDRRRGFVGRMATEVRRHGLKSAVGMWASRLYTAVFDELNPLDKAVSSLLKIHERNTGRRLNIRAVDNPYKLQRLATDAAQSGMIDLMNGVVPYRGTTPVGPSMFDALELALGRKSVGSWDDEAVQEFAAYLVARRAIVEYDRYLAGEIPNQPGKFTRGDYEQAVKEFEAANPEWRNAADILYKFQDNLLKKKFDAGFLTPEQYADFSAKADYVPFQRDMADFGDEVGTGVPGGGATARGTGKAGIVKAFRGSQRAIINPLESIMRDALQTANLIARNEVFRSLDALARMAGPGGGSIAERIKATQIRANKVDVTDVLEAAAKAAGLDPRDTASLVNAADSALGGNVTATLFRAGDINEAGEPIVYFWQNGRKQAIRLADGEFGRELYAALTGLSKPGALDPLVNALTIPSVFLRAGITTSPDFLISNYIRDQLSAWVLSDDGFVPFVTGARGMVDEVFNSDFARMYSQAGGIMGGANVSALSAARIDRDIQALRKKGYAVQRLTSVRGLAELTELSETGTRVGLFRLAYQRARKDGMNEYQAMVEAAFTARDYIDFGRHGSKMLAARKLIPFLNASLQGMDKSARTLIAPLFKLTSGKPMTAAEKRQVGAAAKAWAKVATIGTIGVFQSMLYRDDPEYEEISDYLRATHWMFKIDDGNWVAIPKPFDLAILSNIFERAYEAGYKNDPTAWERLRRGFSENLAPPVSVPGLDVGFELATNHDFFRDRSIVPDELQGLEAPLQWNAYTSEFGKFIGKQLNVSPMYVDHAITGWGGSWGRSILEASNMTRENAAEGGLEDQWITRRFVKDASRGATSSEKFWDLIGRGSGEWDRVAQTYKEMSENGTLGNADAYLQGKPDQAVAYALLNHHFDAGEKRIHPLRRAKDVVTTISKVRQEMALDRVLPVNDEEAPPIALTPAVKGQVDDVLSRLSMIEARNGLIATEVEGWKQKAIMDTAPVWKELEAASPALFEEIETRFAKAKIYPENGVRRVWPEAKQRIMQERQDAVLSDLAAEARAGD